MTRIEDYALLGDLHTAALVGADGSIDWLCLPRFDGDACFAALLGTTENGRWRIAPTSGEAVSTRRYRDGTLVLETTYASAEGEARVIDFMPVRDAHCRLIRLVVGVRGSVAFESELVLRFEYGSVVPWVREHDHDGITAIAGPIGLILHAPVKSVGEDFRTRSRFTVRAGERVPFTLTYFASHEEPPAPADAEAELVRTSDWWTRWADRCTYVGPHRDAVRRSLVTLKALTYQPTGAIVAAPTTSLPEQLGGAKNWDYRFCWLRDATFSLFSLVNAGYRTEAKAWRDWLLRAFAGNPRKLQIMYGLGGERRLEEWTVPHLAGYEGAAPVRVGNGARSQAQYDVFGEVVDSLHQGHAAGIPVDPYAWDMLKVLLDYLESNWQQPGSGMWEVRESVYQFTEAKVLSWVAADRMVRFVEDFGFDGPADRWRALRARIHEEVCAKGYDPVQETFTQYYGSKEIDASALLTAGVGFLPPSDPRVRGTIRAVETRLMRKGFVHRYEADFVTPGGETANEGAFLACNFWLVDNYLLAGRRDEATALFERVLDVRSPLGLLSEEYDVDARRLTGNFPQAFSHVGLINSGFNLLGKHTAARQRAGDRASRREGTP